MTPCSHEPRIVEAARAGRLAPEHAAHLASCPECREVAEAVQWMSGLAAGTERLAERRRLAQAGQLWWKGQLARRWEAETRAVAPLDTMQRVEVAAGLVAAVVLLVSFFDALGPGMAGAARDGFWPALSRLLASPALGWIVLAVLGAAVASVVMFRRLLED